MFLGVLRVAPGTVIRLNYRVWNLIMKNYCAAFSLQTVVRPTEKNLYFLPHASLQDDGSMHKANSLKLYYYIIILLYYYIIILLYYYIIILLYFYIIILLYYYIIILLYYYTIILFLRVWNSRDLVAELEMSRIWNEQN